VKVGRPIHVRINRDKPADILVLSHDLLTVSMDKSETNKALRLSSYNAGALP